MKTREPVEWKFVPLLVLYHCDIPVSENISAVRHVGAAKRSFVRYMVTRDVIIGDQMANGRSLRDKNGKRESFTNLEEEYRDR